jgi:DNA-binding LacI/PurR family transcriptional regulator
VVILKSQMKLIAEDAQVSIATVSRVLNGKDSTSVETRERVMRSVEKLGYKPNMIARSLRTRKSFVLGLIIPSITNPFFTNIARAVEDIALQSGYVVTIFSSDQNLEKEKHCLEFMCNRMVDGALVAVADQFKSNLDLLANSEIPVVLIDRCLENASFDRVMVDTYGGTYRAVEYLLQRGYHRIGMIAGPQNVSTAVDKALGYKQALADHNLPLEENLLLYGDYTEESGVALGRHFLSQPQPPDAVIVSNNLMTLGLYRVIKEYGLRIPHEIALVGFDDIQWSSLVTPPITMVDQPTYELGKKAIEFLLERIAGNTEKPRKHILRTQMVIRGSA